MKLKKSIITLVMAIILLFSYVSSSAAPTKVIYPINITSGSQLFWYWYLDGNAYRGKFLTGCNNSNPQIAVSIDYGWGYQFVGLITLQPGQIIQESSEQPKYQDVSTACRFTVSSTTKNMQSFQYLPVQFSPENLMMMGNTAYPPPPYP